MIFSNECWLKSSCAGYIKDTCGCRTNEEVFCKKLFKLEFLYDSALLSKKQRQKVVLFPDSDGTDEPFFDELSDIEKNICTFIENGQNIYIYSTTCGNGKTEWSLKLLKAYLNKIWYTSPLKCRALFINVPRFLLAIKDSISNKNEYADHIKENILSADLIVWDEVATKSLTVYEHEQLLSFINARLDDGKSNIYTSNMQPYELEEKLGQRLTSRIIKLSKVYEFKGKDKRGVVINNDSVTGNK